MGLPKDRSQLFGQAVKAVESPRLGPSSRSRLPRRPKAASAEGRSFPTWVLFDTHIYREDPQSFCEDDPETPSARFRASNGDDVLVSLRLVAPPWASHLRLHYSREVKMFNGTALVAAHLDSVLFRVVPPSSPINAFHSWCCHTDYFVCKAGPSGMSIFGPLPPCYKDERRMAVQGHAELSRMLDVRDIGLLRRGEDFAVADLKVLIPGDSNSVPKEAELFRYRSNALTPQWEVKRILICQFKVATRTMGCVGGQLTRSSPLKATCAGLTTTGASCSVTSLMMIPSYSTLNCLWSLPKAIPLTLSSAGLTHL